MSIRLGQRMWQQLFQEQTKNASSLQGQIRTMLGSAILNRRLPHDSPLPSCRELAKDLNVSRNTVVFAYQQLVDEGYLIPRERSGYFVNPEILKGRAIQTLQPSAPATSLDWESRLTFKPSLQRNITKAQDWQGYAYPFNFGQCDPSLFPVADWRECCKQALNVLEIQSWVPDRFDTDDPLLIEQIQTRLLPRVGIWASPDQILTTVGAQQALYILATLLIGKDKTIGIEEPGYPDARNIFSTMTSRLKPLPIDHGGLIVDERLDACDYVYVTPSHQSPTTVTMPMDRRRALLERAVKSDFVLIEDDYESELNYVGNPSPALKSFDQSNRVIYVSSLSKTLSPGIRFGFMVAAPELIREARALRRLMVRHPATNNQRAIALFLAHGHHDALIQRLRHAYKERWQAMADALERHLPDSSRKPTFGGTSYWVKGPDGLDARELTRRARERSILIEPGDVHFMAEPPPLNYFRLGFSSIATHKIDEGVRQIAELIDQMV
ncbi:MAG: 2-aminoadipate aminotransferase [Herminiimonas sp.]|nr:2-aminoadipate aminotransferase [Herminiimonas sp.]